MKIKSIEAANFKSFSELKLENIGNMNTLIGKNSSGKSNILQLIRFFFYIISTYAPNSSITLPSELWHLKNTKNKIKIQITFGLSDDEINALGRRKEKAKTSTEGKKIETNILNFEIEIDNKSGWKLINLNFNGVDEKSKLLDILSIFKEKIQYISITRNQTEGVDVLKKNSIIPKDTLDNLVKIETNVDDSELDQIRGNLFRNLLKTSSIIKDIRGYGDKLILNATSIGRRISISELGGGDQELLQLIYEIIKTEFPICLIEEPEVHLHAELQRELYKIFKKYSSEKQFIFTTHSSIFVDKSRLKNTYAIDHDGTKSEIRTIDDEKQLNVILSLLGIKPSDIFFAEKLLFVEGESDRLFYSLIAKKLKMSFSKENIAIYPLGGKSKGKRHLKMWNEITKSVKIPKFFILDKDAQEEAEGLLKEDEDVKYKVLKKGELEDYYPTNLTIDGLNSLYEDLSFDKNDAEDKKLYDELSKTDNNAEVIYKILGKKRILSAADMKDNLKKNEWKYDLAEYVGNNIQKEQITSELKEVINGAISDLK